MIVTGRNQDTLDAAVDQLGPEVIGVRKDSASTVDIDTLADTARDRFGTVDLLFVNAGITRFVSVEDMTEAVYDEVFAVNTRGAYFTVQKLAPLLSNGGAVVLTTSVADVKGLAMSSVYAASKAAVRSMTRSFAHELQPRHPRQRRQSRADRHRHPRTGAACSGRRCGPRTDDGEQPDGSFRTA